MSSPPSLFHDFVGEGISGKTKGSAKFKLPIAGLRFSNTSLVADMAEGG